MARPIVSPSPQPELPPSLPTLPVTTLGEQNARQRISPDWQPSGFSRYRQQQALLEQMSVLGGGIAETGGADPDRYLPVSPLLEVDFPVRS